MRSLYLVIALIITVYSHGQDSTKVFKTYSLVQFKNRGIDIAAYNWHNAEENKQFNRSEQDFRISKGLLGGGLAWGFIGSGAVVIGALNTQLSPAINKMHVPLLASGIALNMVAMPICFVMREIMIKRGTKRLQRVKSHLVTQ
ncbi:MAG: hypothetical protein JST83_08640 [Bacteroidetes bacterium]|nr:hypothetical protein [Bacteroidota bacterium]